MQHATLRTISYTLKTGCALTIKNHQCTTTSKIFLHFEDLGIYNLLMSITDKEVFKDYYNDTLGELIEYDKNNDSNILEVLKYYLENNGSVQKTAEHFYVHRNSINYRLNKVQDILDMDISDLDNRIQLRLAFMVRDMLD